MDTPGGTTVADAVEDAARSLADAGVDAPRLTAELLMAHALGMDRAGVYARLREKLDEEAGARFTAYVKRRAAREPLQYITGRAEFCGLEFALSPDVLIPRPETELLVEEGLRAVAGLEAPVAADIGTGSGCVAVALAARAAGLTVYAVDSSPVALEVARKNMEAHGLSGRVILVEGDLFGALEGVTGRGGLDLIVSNPPYIPSGELDTLQPEVGFEPVSALDGGPDGLDALRRIIADAPAWLKSGGTLLVEVGAGQSGAAAALVAAQGALELAGFISDFAGIERVLKARRL